MSSTLSLHASRAAESDAAELLREVLQLEADFEIRRQRLNEMQAELQDFKARYVEIVGSRMTELAELEQRIYQLEYDGAPESAEPTDDEHETNEPRHHHFYGDAETLSSRLSTDEPTLKHLRKLFWSVAKIFHPDHGINEEERTRRHEVMTQASRAYKEGDEDLLTAMLADGSLQLHCATARGEDDNDDETDKHDGKFLQKRRAELLDQLRTIDYGIKRTEQNPLYKTKLEVEATAAKGRDGLGEMQARVNKRIKQARLRLDQLELGVI